MFIKTKTRSNNPEIMDDFDMKGDDLKLALDNIALINTVLGGNKLTLNGVIKLIEKTKDLKGITIADIGCGNGDMLRKIADFGLKNNLNIELIGVDANEFTINYARELSKKYPNISFICENVSDKVFSELKYDIALCTLTLHHFDNIDIEKILALFHANSNIGFVINDLHRSATAYRLFQIICFVFRMNKMSQKDGLTSILRGFKKRELIVFSEKLKFKKYTIDWKWAFRYQWIVEK